MGKTKDDITIRVLTKEDADAMAKSLSQVQLQLQSNMRIPLSNDDRMKLEEWKDSKDKYEKFFYDRVSFLDAVSRTSKHSKSITLQPEIIASVLRGIDQGIVSDDEKLNEAFTKGLAKALNLQPDNQIIAALVVSEDFLKNAKVAYNNAVKARVDIRNSSPIAAFCDWCAEQLHKIIPEIKDVFTQKFEENPNVKKSLNALYNAALDQGQSRGK